MLDRGVRSLDAPALALARADLGSAGGGGAGTVAQERGCGPVRSNGRSALVAWWGSLWSVGREGTTEWGLRLQDLVPAYVSQVRLRGRPSPAAAVLGLSAHAPLEEMQARLPGGGQADAPRPASRRPDRDDTLPQRARAYESITGDTEATRNGACSEVIRFIIPSSANVSFLAVVDDDWLVGSGNGRLFRLNSRGQVARLRVGSGALFYVRDSAQQVVAICSYSLVGRSLPNLWFVDAPAPVRLPDEYPWPDHLLGSYGHYLLAHRPRARNLALIDETGTLAVQLRCPLAITSLCVTEGALVLAAGALICLEIDGLSPLTRTRIWQPPFTGDSSHQPRPGKCPKRADQASRPG